MRPKSKPEFIKYCKQQLGEPVIRVNISDEQADNRISEALDLFNDYHRDATEFVYVAVPITDEIIARGYVETPPGTHFVVRMLSYDANVNRVTGSKFSVNGNSYTGFYGNGLGPASGYGDDGVSSLYIYLMDQSLAERDMTHYGEDTITWNRHTRRLFIETDLTKLKVGNYLIYEAYVTLESMGNTDMWNNDWLKRYATALIQKQWGINLTKFSGGSLFGSDIQLNGSAILQEANEEIDRLKADLYNAYSSIPPIMLG